MMMQVYVNEEPRQISPQSTIFQLLEQISVPSLTGIAVAVNDQVIRKTDWEQYRFTENDNILIIKATQGG